MKAFSLNAFACGLAVGTILALGAPLRAEPEPGETAKLTQPLQFEEPATVDNCLNLLERIIEHALGADMLDDQIDKSEAELERMETACYEKRFPEALDAAKAIAGIVASNK
jgi:hypothetical protein